VAGHRPQRRPQHLRPRARTLAQHIPGITVERGYQLADQIHRTGQAIVWSGHKELAEHYWEMLKDAGLTMAPLEQG
jgi:ATP-dependent Clp protease adaptor protein ClpS